MLYIGTPAICWLQATYCNAACSWHLSLLRPGWCTSAVWVRWTPRQRPVVMWRELCRAVGIERGARYKKIHIIWQRGRKHCKCPSFKLITSTCLSSIQKLVVRGWTSGQTMSIMLHPGWKIPSSRVEKSPAHGSDNPQRASLKAHIFHTRQRLMNLLYIPCPMC